MLNQAYNHGALAALHDHGIIDAASFKMDDTLKAELTPLIPYMTYVRRRLAAKMLAQEKGSWKPYRDEFGIEHRKKAFGVYTGVWLVVVVPLPS